MLAQSERGPQRAALQQGHLPIVGTQQRTPVLGICHPTRREKRQHVRANLRGVHTQGNGENCH